MLSICYALLFFGALHAGLASSTSSERNDVTRSFFMKECRSFFGEKGRERLLSFLKDHKDVVQTEKLSHVIDVGANAGQGVAEYRSMFGDVDINLLEAHPKNYERLTSMFSNDPRIHVRHVAATNFSGEVPFSFKATNQTGDQHGGSRQRSPKKLLCA